MYDWIKTKAGKEYPIQFSQAAYRKWMRHNNLSFNDIKLLPPNFTDWDMEYFFSFMWTAMFYPCKDKNIEFPYDNFDDFNLWVESDDTILVQCTKIFVDSQPKAPEEADQKKPLPKARPGVRR